MSKTNQLALGVSTLAAVSIIFSCVGSAARRTPPAAVPKVSIASVESLPADPGEPRNSAQTAPDQSTLAVGMAPEPDAALESQKDVIEPALETVFVLAAAPSDETKETDASSEPEMASVEQPAETAELAGESESSQELASVVVGTERAINETAGIAVESVVIPEPVPMPERTELSSSESDAVVVEDSNWDMIELAMTGDSAVAAGEKEIGDGEAAPEQGASQAISLEYKPIRRETGPGAVPELAESPDPASFTPWWHAQLVRSLRENDQPRPVDLSSLILGAVRYSPHVRAISDTPLIFETAICEAEAKFDWRSFMDTRFDDINEPVGNTLTTGGARRFSEQKWTYRAGMRRTTESGAAVEISQQLGYQDNNSRFFVPTQQGSGRLALSFTQPLLNGSGVAYNTAIIVLAQIDADAAADEFSRALQDHLLEVTRAYWDLYRMRAAVLQQEQLLKRGQVILEELESRREIDAMQNQIARARAAVASREAQVIRAATTVRNIEARLRTLVNDPYLISSESIELLPLETPAHQYFEISLRDSLVTALEHRPEISQAMKSVQLASVRADISRNELLPALDLIMEAYVAGLEGHSDVFKAVGSQFSEGQPSYSVGLVFELPVGNRAAKARHLRRRLEVEQLTKELIATTETLKAEVEIAVREVDTAYREMQSKFRAMRAAEADLNYLNERWKLVPGEDQVASFLLEDVLDAQERLATEEAAFVSAQVAYTLSLAQLKRATGTLLEFESIATLRSCEDGLPQNRLERISPK